MNPNFSPADSLLSGPSDAYPSLFDHNDNNSPTVTALTPRSLDESEREFSGTPQPQSSSDATEKKAVKKRKSWGQELPTPKTNLPPRKRAKTEDEKEQRRIERVLRNRAAAQSSRERKRKEVEGLEDEKREIERASEGLAMRLRQAELENHSLRETVAKMAAEMTVFRKMIKPSDLPTPDQSSKTTSPSVASTLFQDSAVPQLKSEFDELDFALPPPQSTVDPRDAAFASPSSGSPKADPTATSPDLTQHPAAMLCDLQCQSGDTRPPWGPVSSELSTLATPSPRRAFLLTLTMMTQVLYMSMVSAVYSRVLFPTAAIFHSLTTASAPSPPTMAQLRATLSPLIRSWISTPSHPASALWATITANSTHSTIPLPSILPISLLRRLLACSPALARPSRDATGRALRLMSSDDVTRSDRLAEGGDARSVPRWQTPMATRQGMEPPDRGGPVDREHVGPDHLKRGADMMHGEGNSKRNTAIGARMTPWSLLT